MDVLIGEETGEHVLIRVSSGGDPEDYHWLGCEIHISAGAFSGGYRANLRAPDFQPFRAELESLYRNLIGTATFTTLEEQLELCLVGDGKGHILVEGTAIDSAGTGNRLIFSTGIDQTYLPRIIAELRRVEDAFPING